MSISAGDLRIGNSGMTYLLVYVGVERCKHVATAFAVDKRLNTHILTQPVAWWLRYTTLATDTEAPL